MAALRPIRLVTFDALYTLIYPREPIHVQYSQTFAPYLGVLDAESLRQSFRSASKAVQATQGPAYPKGSRAWWAEVIRRTALGAGGDAQALDTSLDKIVDRLMGRFSSKEAYNVYGDVLPTLKRLHDMHIRTAVVSNADSRLRSVFKDLEFPESLEPIVLSEEVGVEKPSKGIFSKALAYVNSQKVKNQTPIMLEECLHVGDEFDSDYHGAKAAGMNALLLRRPGEEAAHTQSKIINLQGVDVVESMDRVVNWVTKRNGMWNP